MRLEWIEDLIAVAEGPTLTAAAAKRHVTQPAFTRRLRCIEEFLGIDLVDRGKKPARPTEALLDRLEDLRALATRMRRLSSDMVASAQGESIVAVSCQHSIALSLLPQLAPEVHRSVPKATLRLRAANYDDCYSMLMTGQAGLMFAFQVAGLREIHDDALVERALIFHERLTPVVRPGSLADVGLQEGGSVPFVAYPKDSYLGDVMNRFLLDSIPANVQLTRVCETALTPALRELAVAGMGMAWLPRILVSREIAEGRLKDLSSTLGDHTMDVVMVRLRTPRPRVENEIWRAIRANTRVWLNQLADQPPPAGSVLSVSDNVDA